MKKFMTVAGALSLLAFGACKKEAQIDNPGKLNAATVILPDGATLPNIIATGDNYILQSGKTYFLNGKTYVDEGATLTIYGGVTIKGRKKSIADSASALVITKGAKLFALGKKDSVIVFTSNEATKAPGDWGGIVLLGRARTNQNTASSSPTIEGVALPTLPAGIDVTYGSNTDANNTESSGTLQYVRIEYAGAAIAANNELNSLTFGGVGSGTIVDHIEAAYGADDSFEFFGGTVSPKYLVSLNTNDDIFDFDFGYNGSLQFILGVRRSGFVYADANGIESDNDANTSNLLPRTQAKISNMTLIGGENAAFSGTLNGARFRRRSSQIVRNSVILGYSNGVAFESDTTIAHAPNFKYNVVHGFTTISTGASLDATNSGFADATDSNLDIELSGPFATPIRPYPVSGSIAATGANFTGLSSFFTVTTYRGAFDVNNRAWLDTWTTGL